MFRCMCDPSSGITELCLTEITRGGSHTFFVCFVGVWQRNFEAAVYVHGTTGSSSQELCILPHSLFMRAYDSDTIKLLRS